MFSAYPDHAGIREYGAYYRGKVSTYSADFPPVECGMSKDCDIVRVLLLPLPLFYLTSGAISEEIKFKIQIQSKISVLICFLNSNISRLN